MSATPTLALIAGILAAVALATSILWWRERAAAVRLRARLEDADTRAREEKEARDAFFNLISHELRSPIAAIIGYQELLRDGAYGELGDGAAEPVDRIGRSAYHLLHLIDGVMDLAIQKTGALVPDLETVPLDRILARASRNFHTHASERALRHSVDVDPQLPEILTDRDRLERAIDLLLVSAVKYPAGDGVQLHARREEDGVTIRITGTRLPLRHDTDDPILRTGIRLAIVAGTARLLGAELTLDPPDQATARTLTLRVRPTSSL
jgi:signal transduction histidine kinase